MSKFRLFLEKSPTARPVIGEIIKSAVKGQKIATWPADNGKPSPFFTFIINAYHDDGKKTLVAVTDKNFNADNHIEIPLVCLLDDEIDDIDQCIQIVCFGKKHAEGEVGYEEYEE